MYKECKSCKERLMIIQEGYPKYTHGAFTIYGCPSCGHMEFEYDNSNVEGNCMKSIFDPMDISRFHVSN